MNAETPRIAPSAPRYGPQGPETGADGPQVLTSPSSACRRSPFRTVWDELGYLHDHPATGESLDGCRGCAERSGDSRPSESTFSDSTTLCGTAKLRFVVNPPRACGKGEWKTPYYHAFVVSCYELSSYNFSPLTLHKPSAH